MINIGRLEKRGQEKKENWGNYEVISSDNFNNFYPKIKYFTIILIPTLLLR